MSSSARCLMPAHEVFAVRRALGMSVDHGIARPESSISGRRRRAADSYRLPTMSRTDVEKCCSKESLELMPGIRMLRIMVLIKSDFRYFSVPRWRDPRFPY